MHTVAIGIDVGGTAIKGAGVDPRTGAILTDRHRVTTPVGGAPTEIASSVAAMTAAIRAELPGVDPDMTPIGITLPGVVQRGIMLSAANVDDAWIGLDAAELFRTALGAPCTVMNDADAAGTAEAAFGVLRDFSGVALVLTFGTGVGSACLHDRVLVPNFELGHLHLDGHANIEQYITPKVIEREGVSLAEWADRAAHYVRHLELVLNPDCFVLGGSISKNAAEFLPFDGVLAPVIPAAFRNDAGIVGAAALAVPR